MSLLRIALILLSLIAHKAHADPFCLHLYTHNDLTVSPGPYSLTRLRIAGIDATGKDSAAVLREVIGALPCVRVVYYGEGRTGIHYVRLQYKMVDVGLVMLRRGAARFDAKTARWLPSGWQYHYKRLSHREP